MNRWKTILRKILFPPLLFTLLFAISAFALLIYVLENDIHDAISYIVYACSFYALIITITMIKQIIELLKRSKIVQKIMNIGFVRKLITNALFRSEFTLHGGLIASSIFAFVQIYSACIYSSAWASVQAGYYILLVVIRSMLVLYVHQHHLTKDLKDEYRIYRKVGILLLFMNQVLTVMTAYMVHQNAGSVYSGNMIYIMAIYAFYMTSLSIISTIRFHKKNTSPVLSAAKVISLTSALVSMLSLETAMINEFGKRDIAFRRMMTGALGGSICVFVLLMAIYMIVISTKVLKGENINE